MKHYKALFFDFDDTLFDFKKSEKIALEATFSRYGIPANDKMYRLYDAQNQAYWRGFEKGIYKNEGDSAIRFVKFCQAIGRNDIDGVEMCEHYIDVLCSTAFEIENSVALLQKLSKYYDIYIITNALARVNDARSKIGGILPFVKDRFISERIGISKPQKGFFDYCFAHIPYTKEETLLIGDSLISDIRGGIDYGMDTCWFNRLGKENTEQMPITFEITALSQLEKILLKGE